MTPAATVAAGLGGLVDSPEARWAQWVERGRAHDRKVRRRTLDTLAVVAVLIMLGGVLVMGLG